MPPDRVVMVGWIVLATWLGPGLAAAEGPCDDRATAHGRHATRPRFTAEVAALIESDSSFALLHVELPYSELAFRKVPGGLEASFDLVVHVYRGDRQVNGDVWNERVRVAGRSDLTGKSARFARDIPFALQPGVYQFDVRLAETNAGLEGRLCLRLEVPLRLPGQVFLSSVLVGECGLAGSIRELRRDPHISADIDERQPTVCAYAEAYRAESEADSIALSWGLQASTGEMVREGKATFVSTGSTTRLTWEIELGDLWLDAYLLEVVVRTAGQEASGSATILLQSESDPALSAFFREGLGVLAYISEEDEFARLRMATPEDRQRLWDEFWAKRDPTPGDGQNEFKEEFFQRVHYANREFTVTRPGWKTDRGRTYIVHGPPDDIRREPYYAGGQSVEVWYYDQLGMRFVFVDRTGYGDYELRWSE
jgi:GWxTD domain-containing protein